MLTMPQTPIGNLKLSMFVGIVVILFAQAFLWNPKTPEKVEKLCEGEPIVVDYPYQNGYLEPWACKVQCDDKVQRYIVYSNRKTTQCEKLPGCRDLGEDQGETCTVNQ